MAISRYCQLRKQFVNVPTDHIDKTTHGNTANNVEYEGKSCIHYYWRVGKNSEAPCKKTKTNKKWNNLNSVQK